jgi:ABC-2 type transport system ATP-binding protein
MVGDGKPGLATAEQEVRPTAAQSGNGDRGSVVEVSGLVKKFGQRTAIDGLDFSVRPGEIFGLLGPNGSGKTTIVNVISGLSVATAGSVSVLGLDPRKHSASVRRRLGVVPQETALYEELSARRNLGFHADLFGLRGSRRRERIDQMLELAQLSSRAKSRVETFSGGMKRRLAIARAMLHDPEVIYLDEPTLGVDVQSRHVIWDYIRQMRADGRTVLLTTNYLEESDELCDRIAVIDHGRLVVLDTPDGLKRQHGGATMEVLLSRPAGQDLISKLRETQGTSDVQAENGSLRVVLTGSGADGDGPVPAILAAINGSGCEVRHITMREPSLDEVFLSLTGRGLRD